MSISYLKYPFHFQCIQRSLDASRNICKTALREMSKQRKLSRDFRHVCNLQCKYIIYSNLLEKDNCFERVSRTNLQIELFCIFQLHNKSLLADTTLNINENWTLVFFVLEQKWSKKKKLSHLCMDSAIFCPKHVGMTHNWKDLQIYTQFLLLQRLDH